MDDLKWLDGIPERIWKPIIRRGHKYGPHYYIYATVAETISILPETDRVSLNGSNTNSGAWIVRPSIALNFQAASLLQGDGHSDTRWWWVPMYGELPEHAKEGIVKMLWREVEADYERT